MRLFFRHHRTLLLFLTTLGLAGTAFAVWAGILSVPFTGGTGPALGTLQVAYAHGETGLNFTGMLPLAADPPAISDPASWDFDYLKSQYIALSPAVGATTDVAWHCKLVPTGTPDAGLMAAVRVRIAISDSASATGDAGSLTVLGGYRDDGAHFFADMPLAELVSDGIGVGAHLTPSGRAVLRFVFYVPAATPATVAGKSVSGTLDFTPIAL